MGEASLPIGSWPERFKVRALSVRQPWASLIGELAKGIELRTWSTNYRGPLLICSSMGVSKEGMLQWGGSGNNLQMPRGVAICIVELVDVRPWETSDEYTARTAPSDDRPHFSWVLRPICQTAPVPIKGQLSLFSVPFSRDDLLVDLRAPAWRSLR